MSDEDDDNNFMAGFLFGKEDLFPLSLTSSVNIAVINSDCTVHTFVNRHICRLCTIIAITGWLLIGLTSSTVCR